MKSRIVGVRLSIRAVIFVLSFFLKSEGGGESDRRADNGNCNLHRRLVHNQITIVNRLEPHSVGLVIQYLVDISAVGPRRASRKRLTSVGTAISS